MFALDLKIKDFFFDRAKVINAVDRARRGSLSRAGAFVRTRARSLLRRRKRSSPPGQPPSVHSTNADASLKKILFGWDPSRDSVIVGPVLLSGSGDYAEGVTVPELLEFGGVVTLKRPRVIPAPRARGRRKQGRPVRLAKGERLNYGGNPFMGPALKQEVASGKIASAWAGSVRSS